MDQLQPVMTISLPRFAHNLEMIGSLLAKSPKWMLVLKADAYGFGAVRLAQVAQTKGIHFFGVATLQEAIELRKHHIKGEILIFGQVHPEDLKWVSRYRLSLTLSNVELLSYLKQNTKPINIHINIDTGMARNGFYVRKKRHMEQLAQVLLELKEYPHIKVRGCYTHFSKAETDPIYTKTQFDLFQQCVHHLKSKQIPLGKIHCASSAATFFYPSMHLDMVRIGALAFGLQAFSLLDIGLLPIFEVKGKLIQIKKINKGDPIGYEGSFVSEEKMKVGIVNLGYADGIPRRLAKRGFMIINGKRARMVGRMNMDYTIIDLTKKKASLYDDVYYLGTCDKTPVSNIYEVAALSKTIEEEILTRIGPRVKRVYLPLDDESKE